jgi:hypothetical protein
MRKYIRLFCAAISNLVERKQQENFLETLQKKNFPTI